MRNDGIFVISLADLTIAPDTSLGKLIVHLYAGDILPTWTRLTNFTGQNQKPVINHVCTIRPARPTRSCGPRPHRRSPRRRPPRPPKNGDPHAVHHRHLHRHRPTRPRGHPARILGPPRPADRPSMGPGDHHDPGRLDVYTDGLADGGLVWDFRWGFWGSESDYECWQYVHPGFRDALMQPAVAGWGGAVGVVRGRQGRTDI